MAVQWFPGHMYATQKAIAERLKSIDVVIELLDARLPGSSANPMLARLIGPKPTLKILNKQDLADPAQTQAWLAHYQSQPHTRAIGLDASVAGPARALIGACHELAPRRGGLAKPMRVLIGGIPNVGKSTLINTLVGKRATRVADEAGVTRAEQRILLADDFYLYDTPGVLWPKIIVPESGYLLAASGAVGRNAYDEESVALELLLRLRRDLVPLLRNFVNLSDFYGQKEPAIFQAGTLYIDQRSCTLCLRVSDLERHSELAPLSGAYLLYCECVRPDEEPITIVAALTGGDADEMLVAGRNALFYDRQGRDWKAQVLRVVEAPISVRQAFWMPYRRLARFISAQAQRLAAAREQNVEAQSAAWAAAAVPGAAAPVSAQAFDIARFAGIFAAIGLALGALGTALAAIMGGFLRLPLWQMPLVLVGLLLLISGPAMLLAWFKLRQRNLGPLLDANGWAVNIRARLNIPFGAALTGVAQLPAGAERSLQDPYAEPKRPWSWYALTALLMLVLALTWLLLR